MNSLMNLDTFPAAYDRDISVLCLLAIGADLFNQPECFLIRRVLFGIADHCVRWFCLTQKFIKCFIINAVMRDFEYISFCCRFSRDPFPDSLSGGFSDT